MTKSEEKTELRDALLVIFGLRHSSFEIPSDFVIRHSSFGFIQRKNLIASSLRDIR